MLWLRIDAGPEGVVIGDDNASQSEADTVRVSSNEFVPLFGEETSVSNILWYGARNEATGETITLERSGRGEWIHVQSGEVVNRDVAEAGADLIHKFRLRQLLPVAEVNLGDFGLVPQPQYVVRFGTNAYNSDAQAVVTLLIGSPNPAESSYYAVFGSEFQGTALGEYVYLISFEYINRLIELMVENFSTSNSVSLITPDSLPASSVP
jgi:hypothetical protein